MNRIHTTFRITRLSGPRSCSPQPWKQLADRPEPGIEIEGEVAAVR